MSKRSHSYRLLGCRLEPRGGLPVSIRTQALRSQAPTAQRTGVTTDGKDLATRQAGAHAEVQDTCIYSLQPLRTPALGVPQVWDLPHLFARAGPQRLDTGDDEVLLVGNGVYEPSLFDSFRFRTISLLTHFFSRTLQHRALLCP